MSQARRFLHRGDGRQMYINHGLGHLTRMGLNVRPEVTVFEVMPAKFGPMRCPS